MEKIKNSFGTKFSFKTTYINRFRVSIDLAIRSSGYWVWEQEKDLTWKPVKFGVIKLGPWRNESWYYKNIFNEFNAIIKRHYNLGIHHICNELIFELANFSNPLNTQRMSMIGGVVIGALAPNLEKIKVVNANDWFKHFNDEYLHIKDWTHLERKERKKLSIEKFKEENFIKENLSKYLDKIDEETLSDIADAYWLGKYYDKITN